MNTKQKPIGQLTEPEAERAVAAFCLSSSEPVLGDRGQESGVCCGRQCFGCESWSAEK